jgi:hypothetical protein
MTATHGPAMLLFAQRASAREDRRVRAESQRKRAELLDEIRRSPDADEGLRRQAAFYQERLEAGMDHRDA